MDTSMQFNKALRWHLDDMARVARNLYEKGWAETNAGNMSLDVTSDVPRGSANPKGHSVLSTNHLYPDLGRRCFMVKATGSRMRDLARDPENNVCVLGMTDLANGYFMLWSPRPNCLPTSELNSHLAIHQIIRKNQPDYEAVLHTHPTEIITLTHIPQYTHSSAINNLLWAMHPETKIVIPEGVGFAPYHVPGSDSLERESMKAFRQHRIILWEKHGSVAMGRTLDEALDLTETVNKSAQIFLNCMAVGFPPQGLTKAQVHRLGRVFMRPEKDS